MNKAILQPEVQDFIRKNLHAPIPELILKGSPFSNVSTSELAIQISALKKAEKKLPAWFNHDGVYYPPTLNLEQTSSQVTARYKATLVSGNNLIDITGGFGIDSFFFSENFKQVVHSEINQELSQIAAHNFKVLGAKNIQTVTGDSLDYLRAETETFDWIFIDPARRDDYGGKVFLLEQCTPDVSQHLHFFFQKANNILIKTSPLLDLTAGLNALEYVAEIHIVSVNNEVKELLWLLRKGFKGSLEIKTINFIQGAQQEFAATQENSLIEAPLSLPQTFIFEPNPAIMKSALFGALAIQTGTAKLHNHSHLFTAKELKSFPGRSFKLIKLLPYNKRAKKELDLKKANITTRNFPKTVEALRKELKISDGGDKYLFFTTNLNDDKIILVCEKAE